MKLKHIISTKQFLDRDLLNEIFQTADEMRTYVKERKPNFPAPSEGKILASLYYESSTRTRFSFESAMLRLGGKIISTENASYFSSAIKGESLEDTIRTVDKYADVIVLRHPQEGSAQIAAEYSVVPIINAGDGTGEHPTQALLDTYTMKRDLGGLAGLKVAFVGDLLNGRTVHSLIYLLALYSGSEYYPSESKIYFVSPKELKIPKTYKDHLTDKAIVYEELEDVEDIINKVNVLYVTRVQKERFKDQDEYERLKDYYIIDEELKNKMKKQESIIMHPFPRVYEISKEVDKDNRAAYFRQIENGLYIRMALLNMIFEK